MRSVEIEWGGGTVTGRLVGPPRYEGLGVLLAHGAGVGQDHPGMTALRDGLAGQGYPVLTFNYPYTEAGRRGPDPQARLLACHRAAAAWFAANVTDRIVLAGRSMGGRMATYLAAEGELCEGLILYAYPLHPPGKPDTLRKDHLGSIEQPMLFITGTRDSLSRVELFDRWVRAIAGVTVHVVEGGDHSFRLPKAMGRAPDEVMAEIVAVSATWLGQLAAS